MAIKTINSFEVTLVYADQSTWFVGGFNSEEEMNKWIDEEKTRPYWVQSTQVQIVDKSYTIEIP